MAFTMMVMIFIMAPRASVAAKRINEVLETKPNIVNGNLKSSSKDIKGEVEFKNVSFKYPDAADYILKNISFKAKGGRQ